MEDLTPLDISVKSFKRKLSGYDPEEVHAFLAQLAAAWEGQLTDRGRLRQEVAEQERRLRGHEEREAALRDALVAAHKSAEQTVAEAGQEAQRILDDAQRLADRLVDEARARAATIETATAELRSRRRKARAELLRLVEELDGYVRDDRGREDGEVSTPRLAVLPRRDGEREAGG